MKAKFFSATAIVVIAVALFATLTGSAHADNYDPFIAVSRVEPGGNDFSIQGLGFPPHEAIVVYSPFNYRHITADHNGAFETSLGFFTNGASFDVTISAWSRHSAHNRIVKVLGPNEPPQVKVTPEVAGPRDYITVTGIGWKNPSDYVSLTYRVGDHVHLETVRLNRHGAFYANHRVTSWAPAPAQLEISISNGLRTEFVTVAVPAPEVYTSNAGYTAAENVTAHAYGLSPYAQIAVFIDDKPIPTGHHMTDREGSAEFTFQAPLDPGTHSLRIVTLIGPLNDATTTFNVYPE